MNDYLILFFQIILTTILIICPAIALEIDHHYWVISILFVIIFYLIQCVLDSEVFNKTFTHSSHAAKNYISKFDDGYSKTFTPFTNTSANMVNKGGMDSMDGIFGDVSENYYGTRIPIIGPYDGVRPNDILKKLSKDEYLKTAHPHKPLSNINKFTPSDEMVSKHKLLSDPDNQNNQNNKKNDDYRSLDVEQWYPSANKFITNTRDCTNYPPGHVASCLIPPHNMDPKFELLDADLTAKEEKFNNIASTPKFLKSGEPWPILYKNAPLLSSPSSSVEFDNGINPPPVINGMKNKLCRNCKVGGCMKSHCGSKQIELGNDNIIDPTGNMANYLRDIALV